MSSGAECASSFPFHLVLWSSLVRSLGNAYIRLPSSVGLQLPEGCGTILELIKTCKHEYCPEPCAAGWIGYEGKCYFFSEEEGNWTHGQNFCSSHGSFLARIETESEKVGLKKLSFSIILYVCVNHSQSSVDVRIRNLSDMKKNNRTWGGWDCEVYSSRSFLLYQHVSPYIEVVLCFLRI
uniref:C-type lectin domain-containing protein n=1 Tax=Varanus komodoensis TaxID=61221 RepID=A0A8D2LKQ5_VARKO